MNTSLKNRNWKAGYRRSALVCGVAAVTLGLLALGGKAITARPERSVEAPAVAAPAPPVAAPASLQTEKAKFVVERVTVFPYGFEPEEITRPTGSFLLAIDNRAGTEGLSFRLETAQRQLVQNDGIRSGRSRTAREMHLAPGTYVLTEDSHPEWRCTITVTGK